MGLGSSKCEETLKRQLTEQHKKLVACQHEDANHLGQLTECQTTLGAYRDEEQNLKKEESKALESCKKQLSSSLYEFKEYIKLSGNHGPNYTGFDSLGNIIKFIEDPNSNSKLTLVKCKSIINLLERFNDFFHEYYKSKGIITGSRKKHLLYGGSEASHPKLDKDAKHLYLKYANAKGISLEQVFQKKYLLYKQKYINLKNKRNENL